MKGTCLVWSRAFLSPPAWSGGHTTKGQGSTGIWNLAHSVVLTRDVTAAMLVSLTNYPGIELNSYANAFFYMLTDNVSQNTLKESAGRNLGDTLHAAPALAPRLEVLKYCKVIHEMFHILN